MAEEQETDIQPGTQTAGDTPDVEPENKAGAPAVGPGESALAVGRHWLESGEYHEALKHLRRATQQAPSRVEAWSLLAEVQSKLGACTEALDSLNKAIEQEPTAALWYAKASALRMLYGDKAAQIPQQEAEMLDKTSGSPNTARPVEVDKADEAMARGVACQTEGNYDKAVEHFSTVIRVYPNQYRGWLFKGQANIGLGQLAEAKKCTDEAAKLASTPAGREAVQKVERQVREAQVRTRSDPETITQPRKKDRVRSVVKEPETRPQSRRRAGLVVALSLAFAILLGTSGVIAARLVARRGNSRQRYESAVSVLLRDRLSLEAEVLGLANQGLGSGSGKPGTAEASRWLEHVKRLEDRQQELYDRAIHLPAPRDYARFHGLLLRTLEVGTKRTDVLAWTIGLEARGGASASRGLRQRYAAQNQEYNGYVQALLSKKPW